MSFTAPPGVFDLLPIDDQEYWKSSYLWNYVETVIRETALAYGFHEIRTPLFEQAALFHRSVGETTDVVSKEMYTFSDKGGRLLALRPEGTAPTMRAFLEHKLYAKGQVHKLFYIAPMFRYERAQAGRYRQHHQFGAEAIGITTPEQDVEQIDLLWTVYKKLGLRDIVLALNSIGDKETRQAFRQALIDYLTPRKEALSEDSQRRLLQNPIRILDSKDPEDQALLKGAPSILDFLTAQARSHFERVQELLTLIDIPFTLQPSLVRGLDYYNGIVFECVLQGLGAQNSIGGGGRFDGLIQEMGGPDLPACGFGTGLERVLQAMLAQEVSIPKAPHPVLYLACLGEEQKSMALSLAHALRQEGISVELDLSDRKIPKMLHQALQKGATFFAVLGESEVRLGELSVKDLSIGKSQTVPTAKLVEYLSLEVLRDAFSPLLQKRNRWLAPSMIDTFIPNSGLRGA